MGRVLLPQRAANQLCKGCQGTLGCGCVAGTGALTRTSPCVRPEEPGLSVPCGLCRGLLVFAASSAPGGHCSAGWLEKAAYGCCSQQELTQRPEQFHCLVRAQHKALHCAAYKGGRYTQNHRMVWDSMKQLLHWRKGDRPVPLPLSLPCPELIMYANISFLMNGQGCLCHEPPVSAGTKCQAAPLLRKPAELLPCFWERF